MKEPFSWPPIASEAIGVVKCVAKENRKYSSEDPRWPVVSKTGLSPNREPPPGMRPAIRSRHMVDTTFRISNGSLNSHPASRVSVDASRPAKRRHKMFPDPESARLQEASALETIRFNQQPGPGKKPWRKWGPYLSERQWGTVREDYSESGNAWDYFTHDQARSRAYHWGEDGLAGISDDHQRLCFALALWNGKDPILKERLFGLTNSESNHGEDVKEY